MEHATSVAHPAGMSTQCCIVAEVAQAHDGSLGTAHAFIDACARAGADAVISFVEVGEKHPARMKFLDADSRVVDPPFAEQFEGQRRQDLVKMYLREGSI